jgi:3-dehydroquinate dehydratase/shikimate dehydrogenase
MGEYGLVSRILARRFGSAWTYAGTLDALGQLTADAMLNEYRFRSIGESTRLFGLVGSPIAQSLSPAMHNAAFQAAGIDAVYLPLRAVDAADFIAFARSIRLDGASVTIPFKVALFDHVDEVHAVARRIGAINTIMVRHGRWIGSNTDAGGFLRPLLQRGVDLRGMRVAVLGAGGSARAVVVALAPSGALVTVYARDVERARAAATVAGTNAATWPPPAGAWDLLVNCTPLGTYPRGDDSPLPAAALSGRLVYDLVYNPPATRLLRDALTAGCEVVGGLEMLVAQAEEQFEWWTGARPPQGVMRAAAEERLAEFRADENHVA